MMNFAPRALTPRDGLDWLVQALKLILSRPGLFIAAALLAPAGSALLLMLPVWDLIPPVAGGWLTVIATVSCYGLPLNLAICLACGFARAAKRQRPSPLRQLLVPSILKVLLKSSLLLFVFLLQGYLAMYLIQDLLNPAIMLGTTAEKPPAPSFSFAVADTLLGTQLGMLGGLLLVLQVLFAGFIAPLYLFREFPLHRCWRLSFLAIQLNPWLWPALGLLGLALVVFSSIEILAIPAQILALPLPAYLGALLYVAWVEVFQGGIEAEEEEIEADDEVLAKVITP
jgi:hypothetical protein